MTTLHEAALIAAIKAKAIDMLNPSDAKDFCLEIEELTKEECTCSAKNMTFGGCCKLLKPLRERFEDWYDAQDDGRLDPWDVFQAGATLRSALAQQGSMPEEQFCYCGDEISLQMVSGGASKDGLYGRVTLRVKGEYREYVSAPAPQAQQEPVACGSRDYCGRHPFCGRGSDDDDPVVARLDNDAVDRFAAAMKAKMAKQRAKGYYGWSDERMCPAGRLQSMLNDHIAKGDPVDVGNFAMMLFNRGEATAAPQAQQVGGVFETISQLGKDRTKDWPEWMRNAAHTASASFPKRSKEMREFDIRGVLAARLNCWHRMSETDSDALVSLLCDLYASAPAPHPDTSKEETRTVVQQMVDALGSCIHVETWGADPIQLYNVPAVNAALAAGQKLLEELK